MDILAARKKAAEQALARKEAEKAQPAVEPAAAEQPHGDATAEEPGGAAGPQAAEDPAGAGNEADTGAEKAAAEPRPEAVTEPRVREMEMLSFRLGREEYALMVEDVKEVLKNRELTPVPNAPDYVLGITSVRGTILPVIDLCKRLGVPAGERDEKSRILVVDVHDEGSGIVVDRVMGVVRIHPDSVRPAPENIEHGSEFLRGIARKEDKLYILLDMEKALGA